MDGALETVLCVMADVDRSCVNAGQLTTREWHDLLHGASRLSRCLAPPEQGALFGVVVDLGARCRRSFRFHGELV